jgi:WD40 repeat protein
MIPLLLSGGGDSAVKLWDVSTGTLVREIDDHHFERIVAVSTNWETMQTYSISASIKLILWDLATGECVNERSVCEDEDLTTVEINWRANGCQVVGGFDDGRLRLLEAGGGLVSESLCRVFNVLKRMVK